MCEVGEEKQSVQSKHRCHGHVFPVSMFLYFSVGAQRAENARCPTYKGHRVAVEIIANLLDRGFFLI